MVDQMGTRSFVYLTNPQSLTCDTDGYWFDTGRQKMLVLMGNIFYWWEPYLQKKGEDLVYFYGPINSTAAIVMAKVSLDSQLIALQLSKQRVMVIDTTSNQKWAIDIKHTDDNEIIPPGIIWSDHGGNSQDLVVLTERGLELYKISSVREQCKLSRTMNQKASHYWYDPSHRVILLSAPQRVLGSNLDVHGFYLRFDAITGLVATQNNAFNSNW